MISPLDFFIFSKFWFTESIEGKMAKTTVQNDKKFCLLRSISQEPCIVWLSFMVLMYKMTISPDVFSVLHNFDLFGLSKGWKGQKLPKMTKNSVCITPYLWNRTSYEYDFWYTRVKWWYLWQFFSFFQNWIIWVFRGVKGQRKWPNITNICFFQFWRTVFSISQEM